MGIPETLTTDGGTTFMSAEFQNVLEQYGVHHRVTSVGFPHANTRAEVAVKTAKRLLRANVPPSGKLNGVALSRVLMQYRNTPDRDVGLSPSELLLGRKLKDFLPFRKPGDSLWKSASQKWKDIADWRELARARRCKSIQEKLTEHTKDLPELNVGDTVIIQNQLGNNPRRWDRRGTIVQSLPNRQYYVKVDGSRRLTLRNRKFLRKISPLLTSWLRQEHSPRPRQLEPTDPQCPQPMQQDVPDYGQDPVGPQVLPEPLLYPTTPTTPVTPEKSSELFP